jgi:hypothetical protein
MTTDAFVAHLKRRWWVVALQAALAAAVVAVVAAATTKTSYSYTAEFVMHPAPSTPTGEVANLSQQLDASGPVVQTVLRVISTPGMVARAAQQARVGDTVPYSLSASVSPGTTVFDATITGPDAQTVQKLGDGLEHVAPQYVAANYHGYSFDLLGNNLGKQHGFPPRTDIVLLALLLGAVVGVGEVFAEFTYRRRSVLAPADAPADASDAFQLPPGALANGNGGNGATNGNGDGRHDGDDGARMRSASVKVAVKPSANGGRGIGAKENGRVPSKKRPSRATSRWRGDEKGRASR